jgi:glucose dehydrogenase
MDYEPFKVDYTAGQPYVGATLSMFPAPGGTNMGTLVAWDASTARSSSRSREVFRLERCALDGRRRGLLRHARGLPEVRRRERHQQGSVQVQDAIGIIGNVFTYEHKGKQYMGVFSGIGGWAGIGMAAGLEKDQDGLGAVGGYKELRDYTELGGSLTVFALP